MLTAVNPRAPPARYPARHGLRSHHFGRRPSGAVSGPSALRLRPALGRGRTTAAGGAGKPGVSTGARSRLTQHSAQLMRSAGPVGAHRAARLGHRCAMPGCSTGRRRLPW
ncbi:MAG: hypothetical protein MZW92_09035 [Comamonadaceae bacterium]|nr:hypothetical protein [Comamonadaceae bacterium]